MQRRYVVTALSIALAILVLASCGQTTHPTGTAAAATPTATTLLAGTAVPATIPAGTMTPAPAASGLLTCEQSISQGAHVTQIEDFRLTDVGLDFLSYPSVMLPDNTPLTKPYQLHAKGSDAYATDFPSSPITDPGSPGNADACTRRCDGKDHIIRGVQRPTQHMALVRQLAG
jgi:hypothetical protein